LDVRVDVLDLCLGNVGRGEGLSLGDEDKEGSIGDLQGEPECFRPIVQFT
jgi:hypothetical protein